MIENDIEIVLLTLIFDSLIHNNKVLILHNDTSYFSFVHRVTHCDRKEDGSRKQKVESRKNQMIEREQTNKKILTYDDLNQKDGVSNENFLQEGELLVVDIVREPPMRQYRF
jgi:hypothetical protein